MQLNSQDPSIFDNTPKEVIAVMPDTLDNRLRDFEETLKKRGDWMGELGLVISILVTLLTVEHFKKFIISGELWQAIFYIALIVAVVKLIRTLIERSRYNVTRQDIVKQLLDQTNRMGAVKELEIVEAMYGSSTQKIDITERLRGRVSGNRILEIVSNDLAGEDPHVGELKSLKVQYKFGGAIQEKEAQEYTIIEIP